MQSHSSKPKVNIYIDGANMFYAQQKMGWFVDWQKVKNYLESQYEILNLNYYVGVKKGDQKMIKFIAKLKKYGYKIYTKPLKKIYIAPEERMVGRKFVYKANFDVEITIHLLKDRPAPVINLFSGDSDFAYAIKILRRDGKKVFVYATKQMLSRELRTAGSRYILLENIKKEIEYNKDNPQ